jgi:DNA-binding NarL/FixJ family response regulator
VAVVDPSPIYRRGVLACLGLTGFDGTSTGDILAWLEAPPRRLVLFTIASAEDSLALAELRRTRPDVPVVANLPEATVEAYVHALRLGASSAVAHEAAPEELRTVVAMALAGNVVLPEAVVHALLAGPEHEKRGSDADAPETDEPRPSADQLNWLRSLAAGTTVAELAREVGYSERAMYRLLRALYGRMGVRHRTEALMRAHARGWL